MKARRRRYPLVALTIVSVLLVIATTARAQDDQETMITHIRDLIAARGGGHFLTPVPGSRSNVIAVETDSSLYFYLERGSIRGSAIDEFYAAYDSGDMEAAYSTFLSSAIMMQRVTDYGWNGLGVPMTTESGREIDDILFKDVGGTFARAPEITEEDLQNYVSLLQAVLDALQQDG